MAISTRQQTATHIRTPEAVGRTPVPPLTHMVGATAVDLNRIVTHQRLVAGAATLVTPGIVAGALGLPARGAGVAVGVVVGGAVAVSVARISGIDNRVSS